MPPRVKNGEDTENIILFALLCRYISLSTLWINNNHSGSGYKTF